LCWAIILLLSPFSLFLFLFFRSFSSSSCHSLSASQLLALEGFCCCIQFEFQFCLFICYSDLFLLYPFLIFLPQAFPLSIRFSAFISFPSFPFYFLLFLLFFAYHPTMRFKQITPRTGALEKKASSLFSLPSFSVCRAFFSGHFCVTLSQFRIVGTNSAQIKGSHFAIKSSRGFSSDLLAVSVLEQFPSHLTQKQNIFLPTLDRSKIATDFQFPSALGLCLPLFCHSSVFLSSRSAFLL